MVLEQVPGILDVENGRYLHEAIARLREAGYAADYRIRQCNQWGDATSRTRIFVVAVQHCLLPEDFDVSDLFGERPEGFGKPKMVIDVTDVDYDDSLVYDGPVNWLTRRPEDPGYDGPIKLGQVANGGIGHSVYSAEGPAVTQKTWGEGPGASTGLYKFPGGIIRRLSPFEAMRAHSFPQPLISTIQSMECSEEECYRLIGNSIPVLTLQSVISHVLSVVDTAQIPTVST